MNILQIIIIGKTDYQSYKNLFKKLVFWKEGFQNQQIFTVNFTRAYPL